MDVKVYQCVIQNVFTAYYTVLTESNSTEKITIPYVCLLYTSDAADEL